LVEKGEVSGILIGLVVLTLKVNFGVAGMPGT